MLSYERRFFQEGYRVIAGVDEAGRGPLAGPVVVAAVVFPEDYRNEDIDDSKKLTEKNRESLFELIKENAVSYGISFLSAEDIDRLNIYEAAKEGMRRAIRALSPAPDLVITDAMPIKDLPVPVLPLVKADAQCLNVAAASILAKVTRDRFMKELDERYPEYGFCRNKGYGTREHLDALSRLGPIPGVHRRSFGPVKAACSRALSALPLL